MQHVHSCFSCLTPGLLPGLTLFLINSFSPWFCICVWWHHNYITLLQSGLQQRLIVLEEAHCTHSHSLRQPHSGTCTGITIRNWPMRWNPLRFLGMILIARLVIYSLHSPRRKASHSAPEKVIYREFFEGYNFRGFEVFRVLIFEDQILV